MTRHDSYSSTSNGHVMRKGNVTVTEIRPLRPNQAVILPGVAVKGKGVKLEVKSRYNYRSRTGFSQNDGIAQFSGSFAKRSYQRSLSVNELSFFDQSDFCNEDFYHAEDFYRQINSKKSAIDIDNERNRADSRTPTTPNPYLEYYVEDRAKVAQKYDLGHDPGHDSSDQRRQHRVSSSPSSLVGRRASPSQQTGTPSSMCARTPLTPARNTPSFNSPTPPRPKTVCSSSNGFPVRLSQRSSSLLTLPTSKNNFIEEEATRNNRSRSTTPTRAFTSHHALCTNQGYNAATSSQGVHGTYEFLFNRHLRALSNLETGSLEFLEKSDQNKPVEPDTESLTESEELDLLGEDLVNSSLAEVTETLDRQIDANETGKRKRISFNVPAIALSPSEEVDDDDDCSQSQNSLATK